MGKGGGRVHCVMLSGLSNTPTNLCIALYCIVFALQQITILRWPIGTKQNHKTLKQNRKTQNRITKLKTESQNPKQNHKTKNRITKPKTKSQNPKQNHKTLKQKHTTQNKITKLKTGTQNAKRKHKTKNGNSK